MRRRAGFSILVIAFAWNAFSQAKKSYVKPVFLPQGFVRATLSGFGAGSSNLTSLSNIGTANPAILVDWPRAAIGFSEQFGSEVEPAWLESVSGEPWEAKRLSPALPQSVGIVFPAWMFSVGLGFNQRYNGSLSGPDSVFGSEKIRALEFNGAIAGTYAVTEEILVNAGVRLGIERLSFRNEVSGMSGRTMDYDFVWAAGFRVDFAFDTTYSLKTGLYLQQTALYARSMTYSAPAAAARAVAAYPESEVTELSSDRDQVAVLRPSILKTQTPGRLHGGVLFGSERSLFLTFDWTRILWADNPVRLWEKSETAASLVAFPVPRFFLSAGVLSSEFTDSGALTGNPDASTQTDPSALFLTAGLGVRLKHLDAEIAFADGNNLETHPWFRQRLFKCCMGYRF